MNFPCRTVTLYPNGRLTGLVYWAMQRIPCTRLAPMVLRRPYLDAECLSECLLRNEDIAIAMKEYEAIRLPATSNIVLQNRMMGPEEVMQIVEERAPDGFDHLYDVISREELESIAARYKKIAGFDKEVLNQKQ